MDLLHSPNSYGCQKLFPKFFIGLDDILKPVMLEDKKHFAGWFFYVSYLIPLASFSPAGYARGEKDKHALIFILYVL